MDFAFFYSDLFNLNLPANHRYPGQKYLMLREALISQEILKMSQLHVSPFCKIDDLLLAHDESYVDKVINGTLSISEVRRIGFPWSESLVRRSFATVGGAIAAAETALEVGMSGQLAGGTHHAHASFGSGYCVFNDFAVAARYLLHKGLVKKVGILDLDVHQGDGNAAILTEPEVLVASVHGEKNFPFRKQISDRDWPLADQCGDELYLDACAEAVDFLLLGKVDVVLYQAGVDALEHDSLGRLKVSLEGLRMRDAYVFDKLKKANVPVSMAIGGGYAQPIELTIEAYVQTYKEAKKVYLF